MLQVSILSKSAQVEARSYRARTTTQVHTHYAIAYLTG